MLEYEFMGRALLVGVLLAIIVPCIGVIVVLKRLSLMGDALSHSSLAGVAAALLLGINPPVLGAVAASTLAALGIEVIRKRMPRYAELSIAIVLSAAVGLSGVLSGLPGSGGWNSYLFGSILAITDLEIGLVAGVSAAVIFAFLLLYRSLFYISFDERGARLAGIHVERVNFLITVLTAVTVSVAARTVGALVVSSLMVVPVACALQLERSFRGTVLCSILFALGFTLAGLYLSFYHGLRPGATIVLVGMACLVLLIAAKSLANRFYGVLPHTGKKN